MVAVERGDGKKHEIRTDFINTNNCPAAKTIILFHGNGMLGAHMTEEAALYTKEGWNVVMMTFGGYPGSDEEIRTTEATTIQDVHAILRYLEAQGVEKIGVHGFSKGGTVAMHAAAISSRISYVVLDMSYTSCADIAANLVKNLREKSALFKYIPTACARGIAERAMAAERRVIGVKDKDGNPYHTDNCNSLEKAKKYRGVFVTIGGNKDFLMGRNVHNGRFRDNFSLDLYRAHCLANPEAKDKTAFTLMLPAEHNSRCLEMCNDLLRKALKSA